LVVQLEKLRRSALAAVVAALLTTLVVACGGSPHEAASPGTTQAHVATTTGTQTQVGTTTGTQTQVATTTATQTTSQRTGSNHGGGPGKQGGTGEQGRPLERLATACRSLPPFSGGTSPHGKAATQDLADRLSARVGLMARALGPKHPDSPADQFLAPFRGALVHLRKAARRANNSPTHRSTQALEDAAARLSAVAVGLGVPECSLRAG
jgi:hypothetical protein